MKTALPPHPLPDDDISMEIKMINNKNKPKATKKTAMKARPSTVTTGQQTDETDEESDGLNYLEDVRNRRREKRNEELTKIGKERSKTAKLAAPKKGRLLKTSEFGHYSNLKTGGRP